MKSRHITPAVLLLLGAFSSTHLAAQSAEMEGFALTAVVDRAHGDLIMAGRYELAEARNRPADRFVKRPETVTPFSYDATTNLCVARTLLGEDAEGICSAAVRAAQAAHDAGRRGRDTRHHLAAALSNRGVVRALAGDDAGARADFARAAALAPDVPAIAQNASHHAAIERLAER